MRLRHLLIALTAVLVVLGSASPALAGDHDGRLYLFLDVTDRGVMRGDIALLARNPRGLFSFTIAPAAPGPLQLHGERGDSGQLEGFWLEREGGFRVELTLPVSAGNTDVSFRVTPGDASGDAAAAGPLSDPDRPSWITPTAEWLAMRGVFSNACQRRKSASIVPQRPLRKSFMPTASTSSTIPSTPTNLTMTFSSCR